MSNDTTEEVLCRLCDKPPLQFTDDSYNRYEKAVKELAVYFTSGNNVPVESANIKASDFFRITGLNPADFVKGDEL